MWCKLHVMTGTRMRVPASDIAILKHCSVCCWCPLELALCCWCCCAAAAELASRAGWASQRCERVLAELLKEGLAMIDDGAPDKVRLYWFPALMHQ